MRLCVDHLRGQSLIFILVNIYLCSMINIDVLKALLIPSLCFISSRHNNQYLNSPWPYQVSPWISYFIIFSFSCSNIVSWEAQWILHLNYLLQDIIIHDSTYELILILSSSICRILLFNHSPNILIHHGSTHKPWCMHNNMYMAFILNPFYLLLASPWNKHPSVHPIFFMHWKWNFPSNV